MKSQETLKRIYHKFEVEVVAISCTHELAIILKSKQQVISLQCKYLYIVNQA